MDDDTTGHAMTEIALALAMAFFCLLVLALISMGNPNGGNPNGGNPNGVNPNGGNPNTARLNAGGPTGAERAVSVLDLTSPAPSDRQAPLEDTDVFLILDGDRFLDRNARPVDLSSIQTGVSEGSGRLVLALSPDSAISSVMRARERLAEHEVVLTTLDADWRRRLADLNRLEDRSRLEDRGDDIRSPAQENTQ